MTRSLRISLLLALALLVVPPALDAQTKRPRARKRPATQRPAPVVQSTPIAPPAPRVVPVEATIRAGIDRDSIDARYIDGSGKGCTTCRFDATQIAAYDDAWNAFLNRLMQALLQHDVGFSELVLRAYFGADGRLDYLLFHVGGTDENTRRFIAAAESVRATFRFALPATGPFKQCATIALAK